MEQSFNREIKISYEEIHNRLNLPREIIVLFNKAEQATENAYAPYSKFKVGSSLLLENGSYIIGNNQENASFPNGICSERVALFSAKANYPDLIIKKCKLRNICFNMLYFTEKKTMKKKNFGKISGFAWGLGFLGGLLSLIFLFSLMIILPMILIK